MLYVWISEFNKNSLENIRGISVIFSHQQDLENGYDQVSFVCAFILILLNLFKAERSINYKV